MLVHHGITVSCNVGMAAVHNNLLHIIAAQAWRCNCDNQKVCVLMHMVSAASVNLRSLVQYAMFSCHVLDSAISKAWWPARQIALGEVLLVVSKMEDMKHAKHPQFTG